MRDEFHSRPAYRTLRDLRPSVCGCVKLLTRVHICDESAERTRGEGEPNETIWARGMLGVRITWMMRTGSWTASSSLRRGSFFASSSCSGEYIDMWMCEEGEEGQGEDVSESDDRCDGGNGRSQPMGCTYRIKAEGDGLVGVDHLICQILCLLLGFFREVAVIQINVAIICQWR